MKSAWEKTPQLISPCFQVFFSNFQQFSVFFRYRGLQWLHRCHPCKSRLRLLLQKVSNKFQLKLQDARMALLQARKMIIRSKSKFRILTYLMITVIRLKGIFCLSIIKDVRILNSFLSSCQVVLSDFSCVFSSRPGVQNLVFVFQTCWRKPPGCTSRDKNYQRSTGRHVKPGFSFLQQLSECLSESCKLIWE